MTRPQQDGLTLLALGVLVFLALGITLEVTASNAMIDFKVLYYSARCLVEHRDPYSPAEITRVYRAEDPHPTADEVQQQVIAHPIYPPTALLLTVPFALLPWGPAHFLWMALIAASFTLAAYLIWRVCAGHAPVISGALIGLLLADCGLLLLLGNAAGVAVTFTIIGAYCIVDARFSLIGVLALAIALLYKPHDAGLIWLALLLAGGVWRKRALQTLAVAAAVSIPAFLWVMRVAPGWLTELRANLTGDSAFAALNDPGRASLASRNPNMVIDLQAAVSVFWADARAYNLISAAICAVLLLIWAFITLRRVRTARTLWFAMAVAAPLTMLVSYHRPHDAKLLLLTMPACALLCAARGPAARLAVLVNTLAFLFTGTIALALAVNLAANLHLTTAT
ncbi:MAG TPA: glycosyltransferase 87 family protein, partial [Terracidiphilus sp.]|nr:glycosyltransferase 87 family protein [Terracidiphilus sp.]